MWVSTQEKGQDWGESMVRQEVRDPLPVKELSNLSDGEG